MSDQVAGNAFKYVMEQLRAMKRVAIAAAVLIIWSGNSAPQGSIVTHPGFSKARAYLEMSSEQQRFYVMGILEGMYLAPVFGAPSNGRVLTDMQGCVVGMSGAQVAAKVLKFAKDDPGLWSPDWDLKDFTYVAIMATCSQGNFPSLKK